MADSPTPAVSLREKAEAFIAAREKWHAFRAADYSEEAAVASDKARDTLRAFNDAVRDPYAILALLSRVERAEADSKRRSAVIERERTRSDIWITRLRAAVNSHRGMSESRGSYTWDDDEYRKEFGRALDTIEKAVARAEVETGVRDRTDCPTTRAEVDAARAELSSATPEAPNAL